MAKIILHPPGTTKAELEQLRLLRNLERAPEERMKIMFKVISLAMMAKGGPLKEPQGKGVVLRSKRNHGHS
jgi:hypothetical protein